MADNDKDEAGDNRFVIDYEVEFVSPPDAQGKAITAGRRSIRARAMLAIVRLMEGFAYDPDQLRDRKGQWVKDPRSAPSLPRPSEGGGAGAGGGGGTPRKRKPRRHAARKPLTDRQFQERADYVDRAMSSALKEHSTDRVHAPGGVWTPERDRIHRQIADDLYARAADVPNEGRAVMAGGLGGAGKSTVLKKHAGIDPSQYLTVNPDDVKEEMVKRGLVPEVPGAEDLSPMERSALVHEESSRIAQMVAQRAYFDQKNMIWDITMSSQSSIDSRVRAMRESGYSDINGVFVDIPTEVSVDRALSRYRNGINRWLQGTGDGGRYVPPRIIRAQQTSGGSTVNRESFDNSRSQFDGWSVYDNSVTGRAPRLVDRSGGNGSTEGASGGTGGGDSAGGQTPSSGTESAPNARRGGTIAERQAERRRQRAIAETEAAQAARKPSRNPRMAKLDQRIAENERAINMPGEESLAEQRRAELEIQKRARATFGEPRPTETPAEHEARVFSKIKPAVAVVEGAEAAGWISRVTHTTDENGMPRVTVEVGNPDTHETFSTFWSTNSDGTYRLAGEPIVTRASDRGMSDSGRGYGTTYSTRKLREIMEQNPATGAQ